MWAELFIENRDNLIKELDFFIDSVSKYRDAMKEGDEETLKTLLAEGKRKKEEVDLS
jgi:Prephenate dehydrogenase